MPFETSEVHLIFGVRSAANRPLVNHIALVHLLLHVLIHVGWLLLCLLLLFRILTLFSLYVELDIVSTCLRPSLNLILNLSSLLLVGISDLDTLAYLLVMGPVERV